ncbi:MAG: HEAT repeat domain-containing protein [Elusimicrobia bacterium]|nr:HEAT repeat domain-containing protein [Elusimicrobiota bacterium]
MKNYYILLLLFLSFSLFTVLPSDLVAANNDEKADIAKLIKELEDKDPKIRKNAVKEVRGVFRIIHSSKEITKELELELIKAVEKRLTDSEKSIRYFTASDLLYLDIYHDVSTDRNLIISLCIEALNEALVDANLDSKVIQRIILYIGNFKEKLGEKKDKIILALKKHLNNKNKHIRYAAAATLGKLAYVNNKDLIMPVFIEALFDTDKDAAISIHSKAEIIQACKSIGPDAKEALPGLVHAIKNEIKKSGGGLIMLPPIYIKALESVTGHPIILIIINDISTYPVVNLFIAFCFALIFRWSIKLREKGKKVFHWFLPVPVLFYTCYCIYNIVAGINSSFELMHNYKIFIFFLSIGFIPWLISRGIIWMQDKKKTQSAS